MSITEETMTAAMEALKREIEQEPISAERVTALTEAIRALGSAGEVKTFKAIVSGLGEEMIQKYFEEVNRMAFESRKRDKEFREQRKTSSLR